ncbi:MAG: helix-turn-helix transcriptional regulator [bacterium]|nr:helix-turn-helix transcriptional regulator [bacterium]
MRTWEDYKKNISDIDESIKEDIKEIEILASIVSVIIKKRNELGITQRELALKCGIPHSSVARIESCAVKPNVETLIKIMIPLGLTLYAKNIN